MAIKLMYITNNPAVASIADNCGVDRIFVDLEIVGKIERQRGLNTVISHHRIEDINPIKAATKNCDVLVRINPLYMGSKKEIDAVVETNADIVMLPYFTTVEEARSFLKMLDGRKRSCLLFETPGAVEHADEILALPGIDEVFVGLNDMHIGYGKRFMFELLADGTVDKLCEKFKARGIPYGFGGIARLDDGTLKARKILADHYRLGSDCVILSRSFCNPDKIKDLGEIQEIMEDGVKEIRDCEKALAEIKDKQFFEDNHRDIVNCVNKIVEKL